MISNVKSVTTVRFMYCSGTFCVIVYPYKILQCITGKRTYELSIKFF
ncbi:hypothetical protein Runsl_3762 [Runella slithyformis DSM 19594]|uniref:Uncharacterized protein n=1 Tax=Runella slithyformis (strain ATCC 29530 / DSM 19594 / LMG 11500 / NCIMB 11436 / LSU 4) TaxID=761193 RepID=A0A7U3ZMU8_RUNSL|nr:hypothetical protein Runsl_3762 [Runella slithyformis DSM 19594]